MSHTVSDDDRYVIASSIWAALDNSIVDEEAEQPEFFAVRNAGAGEMRVIFVDEENIVLRTYKVIIERCEP